MQLRALGRSGLSVSPICLGTMPFGIPVEEPDAIRLVHGAMDLGINFIGKFRDLRPYFSNFTHIYIFLAKYLVSSS